jgi:ribosomal protein S18 acetylase RimI-like enzyme
VEALFRSYPATIFSAWMLDGVLMGLFEGDELCCCGGVVVESKSLELANLGNFLTQPQWRRRGLAKVVAKSLIHKLERDGYRCFLLATTEDNKPAQRVYDELGFRVFEERPQLNVGALC